MDDILTGADDLEATKHIQQQLISLLERRVMELHKWSVNNYFLLRNDSKSEYSFTNETKTLGILCKPQPDCFGLNLIIGLVKNIPSNLCYLKLQETFTFGFDMSNNNKSQGVLAKIMIAKIRLV